MRNGGRRYARFAVTVLATGALAFAALAPAGADATFTEGSAAAASDLFGINIPYGGANIGFGVGAATATFFEGNATASALAVNPGFLRLGNLLKFCGGSFPVNLPTPTTADTNTSAGQPDVHTKNVSGDGTGAATESAAAYPGSRGVGETDGLGVDFGDLVTIAGGTSHAEAVLDPAKGTRTVTTHVAVASVDLLKGLVRMKGVTFDLQQVYAGADNRSRAVSETHSFAVGSVTLGAVPLPVETPAQLASTMATINAATASSGLQLRLPTLTDNGATGGKALTPLTIALGGATTYGKVLYPFLAGTNDHSVVTLFLKTTEPAIFDPANCNELAGAFKSNSQLNFTWNYLGVTAPIVLSAFAAAINGGAEVDFNIGGVRTTIDDTYYAPRVIPTRPTIAPSTAAPTTAAPPPTGAPAPPATTLAAAPPVVVQPASSTRSSCDTTSPVGRPGCWKGAAPIAATVAGVVTLGLLATDEVWRRRRRAAEAT